MEDRKDIVELTKMIKYINSVNKLDDNYCLVFVYNIPENIRDDVHNIECILPNEQTMIIKSFRKCFEYVYAVDGEDAFISRVSSLRNQHKYILVYSMAQNIDGVGRRCLVPLLCEYYNLINIGSGFYPSFLGGSKQLMYSFVSHIFPNIMPKSFFINCEKDITDFLNHDYHSDSYLLKPDDESASIGIEQIKISDTLDTFALLYEYWQKHEKFIIQEYIDGIEIEVPLFSIDEEYLCPGIARIVKESEFSFLDYNAVFFEQYSFETYKSEISDCIISICRQICQCLEFDAISRIDFIVKDSNLYLIDLGANPTISYHSSTNYLFRHFFNDETLPYRLLVYSALQEHKLLEPPLK